VHSSSATHVAGGRSTRAETRQPPRKYVLAPLRVRHSRRARWPLQGHAADPLALWSLRPCRNQPLPFAMALS
jgi:hypothetical protein